MIVATETKYSNDFVATACLQEIIATASEKYN